MDTPTTPAAPTTPANAPATPTQPSLTQAPPPVKKRGGFISLIGKLFLFLFVATALLLGGYYLGTHNKAMSLKQAATTTDITPTEAMVSPTDTEETPAPQSPGTKTVKAGLAGSTAFEPYNISIPTGWTDARETTVTAGIDKLTLTKEGYSITIYQAPTEGKGCIYKGDQPSEMAEQYTDFADIMSKTAQYRRSWNQSAGQTITYTICQKGPDASYGMITKFGAITVVSPNPATVAMLSEIDNVITTLIKQ